MVNELGRPESENEVLFTGNSDGIPAAAVHSSFLGETSVIWRSESTGGNRVRRANSLGFNARNGSSRFVIGAK